MSNITGWGRGSWDEGSWGQPVPVVVTGVSATSSLGTVTQATSNTVQVTGLAATSALGSETVVAQAIQAITGNAGTSALGGEIVTAAALIAETGLEATSALGNAITAGAAVTGVSAVASTSNLGDEVAVFEATHGTAPKYAGQDRVNPGSLILSAEMMLRHMGWVEAADLIIEAMQKTISKKRVTYDFARQLENAELLKCSEFADAIIDNM